MIYVLEYTIERLQALFRLGSLSEKGSRLRLACHEAKAVETLTAKPAARTAKIRRRPMTERPVDKLLPTIGLVGTA